ncbi:unnamed protein product [Caenorhabditis auriculariae]|uniref:Major facilitator superfamily (MFS) profile domain-containing protein n=1 Tax=Caenorhabditis auriculariae TaxID=2777116 RepID=A0A8S1HJK4_9PELO|nr:unnamed protein product [Caenorhabditis auriculariae]
MRAIIVTCLFFATQLRAASIASSSTTAPEPNSSTSSPPFDLDLELNKIRTTCLSDRDQEHFSGDIVKGTLTAAVNANLYEAAHNIIGLTELRSALGFAPPTSWNDYDKDPSKEPTVEAYYELKEPSQQIGLLAEIYYHEKTFTSAVEFFDKRVPSIRRIYRRKFADLRRRPGAEATVDRKEVDFMIAEFRAIDDRIEKAVSKMVHLDFTCLRAGRLLKMRNNEKREKPRFDQHAVIQPVKMKSDPKNGLFRFPMHFSLLCVTSLWSCFLCFNYSKIFLQVPLAENHLFNKSTLQAKFPYSNFTWNFLFLAPSVVSISTAFHPTAAFLNVHLLIFTRLIQGAAILISIPIVSNLIRNIPQESIEKGWLQFSFAPQVSILLVASISQTFDGWDILFYVVAGLNIISFTSFLFSRKEDKSDPTPETDSEFPIKEVLNDVSILYCLPVSFAFFFANQILSQFTPKILHINLGFTPSNTLSISLILEAAEILVKLLICLIGFRFTFLNPKISIRAFNTIAILGMSTACFGLAFNNDRLISAIYLLIFKLSSPFAFFGFSRSLVLTSPRFASKMLEYVFFINIAAMVMVPLTVTIFEFIFPVGNWSMLWMFIGALLISSNLVFLILAQAEEAEWAKPKKVEIGVAPVSHPRPAEFSASLGYSNRTDAGLGPLRDLQTARHRRQARKMRQSSNSD